MSDRAATPTTTTVPAVISDFRGQYAFLSNFYHPAQPIVFEGLAGATVEHLMQAIKTLDPDQRQAVLAAATPREAKSLGRKVTLCPGWDDMRVHIVTAIIFIKFLQPDLRQALLATGCAVLVEGNTWGDTFWGVDSRTRKGENHLGKALMTVREILRNVR